MTERKVNDALKEAATVWQLLFGIGSTVLAAVVFILMIKSDVNAAKKDIDRHEKMIEGLSNDIKDGQEKILKAVNEAKEKINEVKLQLKDKVDRK